MRRDIQRSSNYVLGVVLFAVALFFAGMSTKLTAVGLRKAMLVVGCVLFLGTVDLDRDVPRERRDLARRSARLELFAGVALLNASCSSPPASSCLSSAKVDESCALMVEMGPDDRR